MFRLLLIWLTGFAAPQAPVMAVRSAIRELAPPARVNRVTRIRYARIIHRETTRRGLPAFLAVAFIHTETRWNRWHRSPTNDFGLTQVHVAPRGSARFLGREEELYDPAVNIREWCRLAAMWRDYHERNCHGEDHEWWDHLKWGYHVKARLMRVRVLYEDLIRRYVLPPRVV